MKNEKYEILPYSYKAAKELGVSIKPSLLVNKKIDVFKNDKKIASIGEKGMMDYPNWIEQKGKDYANERRRLYKLRHERTRHRVNTPSYFADRILW